MSDQSSPLSTSALAKALSKTTRQMFAELESLGWISREQDSWVLTAKGEFEGGGYRESSKFGRYIIWPGSITEHKVLSNPDSHLLSTTVLAKTFLLKKSTFERVLLELGWVKRGRKGWLLTSQGTDAGGHQRENTTTAVPYILWAELLMDSPVLRYWTERMQSLSESNLYPCCDGHRVNSTAEQKIDNWLYLAGLTHAYQRPLPFDVTLVSDFYLPQCQLYIEYWGRDNPAAGLSKKMQVKEILAQNQCQVIELDDEDLDNLEEVLPRRLLKFNIEV
ncbi:hypothetical protein [uncultured Neptuniibacter sp.]|uniref:hypothetical protein n=1 Tax=uncultured Neptuniibacter sp. TaxID=502143 RepID=UPI00260D685A|nr:hypothetical protein [uncultured Neptuniibacter sp.]